MTAGKVQRKLAIANRWTIRKSEGAAILQPRIRVQDLHSYVTPASKEGCKLTSAGE
jgi:hypothetical protein